MQPSSQTSSLWSVGNGNSVGSSAPALPATQQAVPLPALPSHADQSEPVLRHVGADPYLTNRGPLSADELRYTTVLHLKNLPPTQAPPSWMTHVVKPIKAIVVDQVGPPPVPVSSGSLASTTLPVVAPASSPTGDVLRHPDPNFSLEELRWRDYQALKQNQVPAGVAGAPAVPPQPAAALPVPSLPALAANPASPSTPIFPTPVRTLFPPTPPSAGVAAAAVEEGGMDTSDAPDAEQFFKCIYATPGSAMASPEEMRIVQTESYKAGKQIVPYWLASGA